MRRARTMSQEDLARLADVTQETISKAERGLIRLRPDLQARIATILGVPVSEIFDADSERVSA